MNHIWLMTGVVSVLIMIPNDGFGDAALLNLGPRELVQANGVDIQVPGYSVPSFVDWNNDGLNDLVIGEGSGSHPPGKVRIYLNIGSESDPQFSGYFYAQSNGTDLTCPASGCLGCFPRVVYWDADGRKDLIIGLADGTISYFKNIGTDESPTFDGGSAVLVGRPGYQVPLDVGTRATPEFVNWDSDYNNRMDLVVGGLDGKIHLYINCGCGSARPPSFWNSTPTGLLAQENGADLLVPSSRSSPVVLDLDGDGKKDLLTGNTAGQLLFYSNVGTDWAPVFSGYLLIESEGAAIDLPGSPRSRPFVCDWTGDGYYDVLIGAGDGKVHLYQSIPQPGDINKDYYVNFIDFALLAIRWLDSTCGSPNNWCNYADLTGDGEVGWQDLGPLAENWLEYGKL